MQNVNNDLDLELDEAMNAIDPAILDKNLARTKGFALGAIVVGAGVAAFYLIKKAKNKRVGKLNAEKFNAEVVENYEREQED